MIIETSHGREARHLTQVEVILMSNEYTYLGSIVDRDVLTVRKNTTVDTWVRTTLELRNNSIHTIICQTVSI